MCDPTPIRNWLIAAFVTLIVAVAAIGAAIGFNLSLYYTYVAPGWMLVAAILVGVSILLIGQAASALDVFCKCAGESCAGVCNNMRNTLNASRVVLGILAATCVAGAIPALIPIVGQFALWPIAGSLLVQIALIITAIVFYNQLTTCAVRPPAPR
ncbi:MAG: hypothetical protein H0X30_12715 [Anaerolineae bacterium]|nr:hypothetical protein [Anaerolineae bacterium]